MASSSSSPSVPAFSSQSWNYDVFLSFRGEDTRHTFVDHLYSALVQRGINTYKDDETLPRGEFIGSSLMKAIEKSQIAVIVLSENYADSSWCLDELAHIIKCKDTEFQIVMPIFYGVDPSEVRKLKRKYGEAFAKHEVEHKNKVKSWGLAIVENPLGWLYAPREQNRKYKEEFAKQELENKTKIEAWRNALVNVGKISGWELKHNRHESEVIKEIVDTILQRLQLAPIASENLIGITDRVQDFKSELQIGSGGVRMIGVWGVGGGGKTTLASSVYDEISRKFEGCCFVKNVREESGKNGLEKLQEKILSDVLNQKQVQKIGRVEEGRHMIMARLCHKKVLIVLDDVDELDQLNALVGSHDWFGEGTRIIITTRDQHLLTTHRIDVMHSINLLNYDEGFKLFSKLARLDNRPMEDYEQLSKEVVSYAHGLPLALVVLGSFLCDKNIHQWRSALDRLKEVPNDDILGTLKISYDGLTKVEKDLFLDIACFFRGEWEDKAMEKLEACGFHPVIGVKVLIQKALIWNTNGLFDMHDLVQEMGHHIVRGEHPRNPEKHSRVWMKKDILKICAMDATTELDMIEAIKVEMKFVTQDLPPIAASMKNLRYMEWEGDPANPLIDNFPPRELCCLILYKGLQKQLWQGCKLLPNLKIMRLHCLKNLIMTPNFDGLPNLERFEVYQCRRLEEVHSSIGRLERLAFLSIEDCLALKMYPPITQLKELKTLSFTGCHKLFNGGNEVASYIELYTIFLKPSPCNFVICWTCGRSNLPGVKCCLETLEEPSLPHNKMGLWFFYNLQELGLRKLDLSRCKLGDGDIGSDVWELPNLQELNLKFNKFSRLDFSLLRLPRLKYLDVSSCSSLVELSELPSSIAVVRADRCYSLESVGDVLHCKWLWKFSLIGSKVGPFDRYILLDSMLQVNAIEDHFISVGLNDQLPMGRLFRGSPFTMNLPLVRVGPFTRCNRDVVDRFTVHLPHNWYEDFCGFVIHVGTSDRLLHMSHIDERIIIIIKQEADEDPPFELWQESNEASEELPTPTYVGYVSFSWLRRNTLLNSSYNVISFSLKTCWVFFAAELVPKKSKNNPVQTTKVAADCSEFWDYEQVYYGAFG